MATDLGFEQDRGRQQWALHLVRHRRLGTLAGWLSSFARDYTRMTPSSGEDLATPRFAGATPFVQLPRLRQVYTLAEVGRWSKTTSQSASRWLHGYSYPTLAGSRWSHPVAAGSHERGDLLSFEDLMEVKIITAARQAGVKMADLRTALEAAQDIYQQPRPLLTMQFKTDGRELFVADGEDGRHVNLSRCGQTAWRYVSDVLGDVRYEGDFASRWYAAGSDVQLYIDPTISFGRPVVGPPGISTGVIAGRFLAGEGIEDIAEDYSLPVAIIEAALRFEQAPQPN